MKPKYGIFTLLIGMLFWCLPFGCTYNHILERRSQLPGAFVTGPIRVMTTDDGIVVFERYALKDTSISGSGLIEREDDEKIPVQIDIPFEKIKYIYIQDADFLRSVLTMGALYWFASNAVESFKGENTLSITPVIGYHPPVSGGSGGSCPFIYSWNGSEYVLEGEGIATAWGRALEMSTRTVLPSLAEEHGTISIRVMNERPEMHYLNSLRLVAAESDENSSVYVDADNTFWPVSSPAPPLAAFDQTGSAIGSVLHANDGKYWVSPNTGYKDVVEMTFPLPESRDDASLVIHAINTKIFDAVMKMIAGYMGDHALEFVHAVEYDHEMISILKDWRAEGSLKASLWNGTAWEPIGTVLPEANEVPFARVVRFNAATVQGDSVTIRLESLADVWKLDMVSVDWKIVRSLKTISSPVVAARGTENANVVQSIAYADKQYAVLLPSDKIDLTFRSLPAARGKKTTYALDVQGYLHEWFPEENTNTQFEFVKDISGDAKISFLKNLLKQKSLFLPMLYAKWREMKKVRENAAK